MDIKRAKEEIKDSIEAYLLKDAYGEYEIPVMRQRPIFLLGAPGIGKTQIMEQVARECGIGLVAYTITHHTRQSAIGLPLISKNEYGGKAYSVTEYTMSEIIASVYKKIEETGLSEGILFIDEINCVSETLAPAMLQFLQYKTFGNHEVPKGWVIVAAGNPPEYNKSVRELERVCLPSGDSPGSDFLSDKQTKLFLQDGTYSRWLLLRNTKRMGRSVKADPSV